MATGDPRLYADDTGVWRQNGTERFGLAWEEIEWVRCSPSSGANGAAALSVEVYAKDGGSGLALGANETDAASLAEVAAAFTMRLGLPPGWYADQQRMSPEKGPLMVWAREAPPRVHADDSGLWCNEFDQFTEWGRIEAIVARRRQEGGLVIELEVAGAEHGHLRELHDTAPGFAECVRAISIRLPGVPAEWRAEVVGIETGNAVPVWRRSYPAGYPRLYADDLGVCREDTEGDPFTIAWDDIGRVLGRKSAGLIEVELEATAGIHLLLRSDWHGFAEVIEAMTARLVHMPAGWLGKIERLKPGHALWRRGWAIAGESQGPDGMPVTAWHRIVP